MSNRRGSHLSLVARDGTPLGAALGGHGPALHPALHPDAQAPDHSATRDATPDATPGDTGESGPGASRPDARRVVGNAVMHAAMSWVACCMEIPAERVEVQQVGKGAFHATVIFADGGHFMLSVALLLETGPTLTVRVEPIHP